MKKGKSTKSQKGDDTKSTKSKASKKAVSRKDSGATSKKEEVKAEDFEIPPAEEPVVPKEEAKSVKPESEVAAEQVEQQNQLDEEQKILDEVSKTQSEGKQTASEQQPKPKENQAQEQVQEQIPEATPDQPENNQEDDDEVNMSIKEKMTEETRGRHLADVADLNRSYNATEKLNPGDDEMMYDPNAQQETYTEVGNQQEEQLEIDENNKNIFDEIDEEPPKNDLMSAEEIEVIQNSWAQLETLGIERVGIVLFKNIFRLAPEAIGLFPAFRDEPNVFQSEAFKSHATTVASTIATVVGGLRNIGDYIPVMQELGYKHAKRGILPEHYPIVGKALLNTLKAGIKREFTPGVSRIWEKTYNIVATTMMSDFYTNQDLMSEEFTPHKVKMVIESWHVALGLGAIPIGKMVFENVFKLDPALIPMFTFTNEENMYESESFKSLVQQMIGMISKLIENFTNLDKLMELLKTFGKEHIDKGVRKQDYETLGKALIETLAVGLGDQFTFELRHAWQVAWRTLKDGVISDNYEAKDRMQHLIDIIGITEEEIEMVVAVWRKVTNGANELQFGIDFWDFLLKICPEVNGIMHFTLDDPVKLRSQKMKLGTKIFSTMKKMIAGLTKIHEDPDILNGICNVLTDFHNTLGIDARHHWLFREAMIEKLEDSLGRELNNSEKWGWMKALKLFRNLMHQKDLDEKEDPETKVLSTLYVRIVQQSWKKLKRYPIDISGPLVYKHTFATTPEAIELFPFKDQKNYLQSAIVKKQTAAVVGIIGRACESLDNFEQIVTIFTALGEEHRTRNITRQNFNWVELGIYGAIKEVDGPHWDLTTEKAWRLFYRLISEKMLKMGEYDHWQDLQHPQQADLTKGQEEPMMSTLRDKTTRRGLNEEESEEPALAQSKTQFNVDENVINLYKDRFKKEVDFHHKLSYRFEKAYRLGKKMPEKRHTLNLEIIDCISDHSSYIEQDHMSLFYLLFFCVYFKNDELLNFIRLLIERIPPNEKVEKFLELIDVHGIDKLRQTGEQMNQFVYHMVLYQAIDDDLRIVYASILRHLRFVQLRDSDAVHLLNTRDYEIIRSTFDKYSAKIHIDQFGYKLKGKAVFKCQSYRKYNQAYYEEIVINYNVESRVAQNYRERFLVSPEDIYIVFEMYCKEDYDDQFTKVKKNDISHKQFVDLFIYCLKNDSFKIAILIYTLYLDPQKDMDERMMDIIMATIKESVYYHEIKLFFIHEHFDVMSVQQLNNLVDIYQSILHTNIIKLHPIVSQFNTIKICLLIYRICWKIEVKQIYSLITKCTLLQDYLTKSLSVYFEKQNNILTLYKMMLEPVLHMTERKDCLDIMYEMNMQALLQHPVIVEVLNLVNEGKYSITASPLSMSQTFVCMDEMKINSLKSMNERLISNIINFGDSGNARQTALQFNIWKQSIDQRQFDEMFFTSLFCFIMLFVFIIINVQLNNLFVYELDLFGKSLESDPSMITNPGLNKEGLVTYCTMTLKYQKTIFDALYMFEYISIIYCVGMISSCSQKLCIQRFKDNVTFDQGTFLIELIGAGVSFLSVWVIMNPDLNTQVTNSCKSQIQMTDDETKQMSILRNLVNPIDGSLNFKYIISVLVIQITALLILMLKRTQYLGEIIQMLGEMVGELLRFFTTFGLIIVLFLLIGRFLSTELQNQITSYWFVFLGLFDAFNGKPYFNNYSRPSGQIYIGVFLFVFKILLVSLLAAMFINRYKVVYKNLDANKRFAIIRLKNSVSYDKYLGAMSLTFFPINILMLPFLPAILFFRSKRASDFVLKVQYVSMMVIYAFIALGFLVIICPILYVKTVCNSIFIAITNKREDFKGENIVQLIKTIFLGPVIIALSLLVDFLTLPGLIMKDSKDFEHKYQQSEHRLNDDQIDVVMTTFTKIFYGLNFIKFKDKHMTLIELMQMHRGIFKMNENLHDLFCKGNKDYKEALGKVQDYNMTKILTRQCSIPDLDGNYKESKVELNVIHAVQFDIELYNYIDVVLRRLRLGQLHNYVRDIENGVNNETAAAEAQAAADALNEEDQDDELKKVEGIFQIGVGPDGNPLKRNNSDCMNNFWVNFVVRSFTNCEEILSKINQAEKRREKRFQQEVTQQQAVWEESLINAFANAQGKYERILKTQFVQQDGKSIAERERETNLKENRKKPEKEGTESTGSSGQAQTNAHNITTKSDDFKKAETEKHDRTKKL